MPVSAPAADPVVVAKMDAWSPTSSLEPAPESRRERYERRSAPVIFVLGMLFMAGFLEVVTDPGDTRTGEILMGVTWVGFVVDLVVRWVLDDDPRTFFRRYWYVVIAVLVPCSASSSCSTCSSGSPPVGAGSWRVCRSTRST